MNSRSLATYRPSTRMREMRRANPCGYHKMMGAPFGDQALGVLKWGALVAAAFALGMWVGKK